MNQKGYTVKKTELNNHILIVPPASPIPNDMDKWKRCQEEIKTNRNVDTTLFAEIFKESMASLNDRQDCTKSKTFSKTAKKPRFGDANGEYRGRG